jgi:hypothetical protein
MQDRQTLITDNGATSSDDSLSGSGTTASCADEGSDLIAVVLARPEIMSLADLAGKPVAIDDRHGSSTRREQNARAAAGAAEI